MGNCKVHECECACHEQEREELTPSMWFSKRSLEGGCNFCLRHNLNKKDYDVLVIQAPGAIALRVRMCKDCLAGLNKVGDDRKSPAPASTGTRRLIK